MFITNIVLKFYLKNNSNINQKAVCLFECIKRTKKIIKRCYVTENKERHQSAEKQLAEKSWVKSDLQSGTECRKNIERHEKI
jgi:hypothetical protein